MNFYSRMVNSRRYRFRHFSKSKYIAPKISKVIREEHERRICLQIDYDTLSSSWDEFKKLSNGDQTNMAKLLSMAVKLFDHPRSDFVQGVLMEYEWVLADFWEYTCDGCGLPYSFCYVPATHTL